MLYFYLQKTGPTLTPCFLSRVPWNPRLLHVFLGIFVTSLMNKINIICKLGMPCDASTCHDRQWPSRPDSQFIRCISRSYTGHSRALLIWFSPLSVSDLGEVIDNWWAPHCSENKMINWWYQLFPFQMTSPNLGLSINWHVGTRKLYSYNRKSLKHFY